MPEETRRRSRWKIVLIVAVVVALAAAGAVALFLGLTGAMADDTASDRYATLLLTAVNDGDAAGAYHLMVEGAVSQEEFAAGFQGVQDYWQQNGGGPDFTLKKTSWSFHSSTNNGYHTTSVDCVYQVKCGQSVFQLELGRVETPTDSGLVSFHIASQADLDRAGRAGAGLSAATAVLLIVGAAVVILALVDCVRKTKPRRVLWIVAILLLNIQFHFWVGQKALNCFLPLGAILYLCLRRRIIGPPPEEAEEVPPPPAQSEDPWDRM